MATITATAQRLGGGIRAEVLPRKSGAWLVAKAMNVMLFLLASVTDGMPLCFYVPDLSGVRFTLPAILSASL